MVTQGFLRRLRALFDLRADTDFERTDQFIRQNVDFKSANAWTLVFAIFIASVGLNVNSTAVIIGAMLISPLMGPIVGAGYALGVNDFDLLKRSLRNIGIAMAISVATSMIFFLLSPFDEAQSEILSRTTPSFYDVLIAVFGGAAGIVALSRTERGNAIPGVAIATALMPPLCTAGFGLANLEWGFFLGAMYLFVINSVFICLSTSFFVRYLRFAKVNYPNKDDQSRIRRWITVVATLVSVPSLVTAWLLLQQSSFRAKARTFIDQEAQFKDSFILDRKIRFGWQERSIELTLVGEKISRAQRVRLEERKAYYGLEKAELILKELSMDERMKTAKASEDRQMVYQRKIGELEMKIKSVETQRGLEASILGELRAFNAEVVDAWLDDDAVTLVWTKRPIAKLRQSSESFLRQRVGKTDLKVVHSLRL